MLKDNTKKPNTDLEKAHKLSDKAKNLFDKNKLNETLNVLDEIINEFEKSNNPKIECEVARAMFNKGIVFGKLGKPEEEIGAYEKVSSQFKYSKKSNIQLQVAKAMLNKSVTFGGKGKLEEEIVAYDKLISKFEASKNSDIQLRVAKAMFNKSIAFGKEGKLEEEIVAYDKLISQFKDSKNSDIQLRVARALFNKGYYLENLKTKIAIYDELVTRFKNSDNPDVQLEVAKTLFNKSILVWNKPKEEIVIYNKLISLFEKSNNIEIKKIVKKAFFEKGLIHKKENQWTEAAKSFEGYLKIEGLWGNNLSNEIIKKKEDYTLFLWSLISIFQTCDDKIQNLRIKQSEKEKLKVCHFTSTDALYSILGYSLGKDLEENQKYKNKKNVLRAYNAIYMNDPSEGKALIEYSHKHPNKKIPDLTNFFKDGEYNWIDHDAAKSVYSISFTEDNDSLTLWRAYGRDGRGTGIVIPVSSLKQSDETNLIGRDLNRSCPTSKEIKSNDSEDVDAKTNSDAYMPENLFEVKYISFTENKDESEKEKADRKIADDLLQSLWVPLEKIRKIKEKFEKEIEEYEKNTEKKKGKREKAKYHKNLTVIEEINKATRESFAGALYLFKDAQYAAEKEYRMLTMRRRGDESICMDEQNPPHLHLETRPFVFENPDTEIIIGPAVERPENVALSVEHILSIKGLDKNVKVKYSKVNYRPAKK
jgi:hypothetical protein